MDKLINRLEIKPLVSIACITFNHEPYIRQCIDGFLLQKTNFPYEIIIHDDASTDKTDLIVKGYADQYPNLIFPICQSENQYSKGINFLCLNVFPKCQGKYIAFCEGDDYWIDPLKLQKQVDFLEYHSEYGLVYTDVNWDYQGMDKLDKSVFKNEIEKHKIDFNWLLINTGYFAPCTWLCKKEYLPSADIKSYVDLTFPWMLDILANSKVYYLPETTSNYRVLQDSASHSKDPNKMLSYRNGIFQIQLDYAKKYSVDLNILNKIKEIYYDSIFICAIVSDNMKSIDECLDYYLINKPIRIQTKIALLMLKYRLGKSVIKLFFNFKHR